jgi:hypothetical protein
MTMQLRHILLAVAIALPTTATAQTGTRPANPERFDVSGLPESPSSAREKEILTLLRYHRRGDLKDAARIHLLLAEYYKEIGAKAKADDCTKMATEAWEAAENGVRVSAGTPGNPPFETVGTFRQNFAYADTELGASHRWEFFEDGTYQHSLTTPAGQTAPPPKELGFYAVIDGQIRLWQSAPALDRTVAFQLLGGGGKEGAVLDGVKMRAVR